MKHPARCGPSKSGKVTTRRLRRAPRAVPRSEAGLRHWIRGRFLSAMELGRRTCQKLTQEAELWQPEMDTARGWSLRLIIEARANVSC